MVACPVVGAEVEYRADVEAGAGLGLTWHLPVAPRPGLLASPRGGSAGQSDRPAFTNHQACD